MQIVRWPRMRRGQWLTTKTVLIMKLSVIFLFAAVLQVSARGNAQAVTFTGKDIPLAKVLEEVEKQTGFVSVINGNVLVKTTPVTISATNISLPEFMRLVLRDQSLNFIIESRTIFISKSKSEKDEAVLSPPPIDVKGRVVNENGEPVIATIQVKGDNTKGTTTNEQGYFELKGVDENAVLVISGVSIETLEVKVGGKTELATISGKTKISEGEPVVVNTGYQQLKPNEVTGSVVVITKQQLDQRVAPDIISKLEGITNALVFHKDPTTGSNQLRIRGESTIFANADPLIVVDNFPFTGNINNINPNDVESITILKDAAAASIWGVRAGNGVIVITTKKGSLSQPLSIGLSANFTIGQKPDLFYTPQITPSDYIDFENFLFQQGYYTQLNNPTSVYSPVIDILYKRQQGLISSDDSTLQINSLRSQDMRKDALKYLYQKPISQQYLVSMSGGNSKATYYFSAGFDKNRGQGIGSTGSRITLNNQSTFRVNRKIELGIALSYSESKNINYTSGVPNAFPYQQLVDEQGNEVPVAQRNPVFEDTIAGRRFNDWKYYPLQERGLNETRNRDNSVRVFTSIKYSILNGLNLEASYQFQRSAVDNSSLIDAESYVIRDRLNSFAILDADGNYIGSHFPQGGILNLSASSIVTHSGRATLNYHHRWKEHFLSILTGYEINESRTESNGSRLIGFDKATGSFAMPTDLFTNYSLYPTGIAGSINDAVGGPGLSYSGFVTRVRSYFGNAAYTFRNKYIVSASARFDGTNYFGVRTNQKTVPLWSTGIKWNISRENFYRLNALPHLSIKLTYGYSGNLDRSMAAVTTFQYFTNALYTGLPYAGISNISNPDLRWEKSGQLNFGIDFGTRDNRISGIVEYFRKNGDDLIGSTYMDPTTGVNQLKGNFSGLRTTGFDIQLNAKVVNRGIKWSTGVNFNYAREMVTRYDVRSKPLNFFNAFGTVTPEVGKPLYGLYSYRWAGLDPLTGDPRFYISDTISKDYSSSLNSKFTYDDIAFSGRYRAPFTGAVFNTITWRKLTFSFNIQYAFGHYFRRTSINYFLTTRNWRNGHEDYSRRWQKPGDEAITDVPSFIFPDPSNGARDNYYLFSTALIERSDNVRLQFINLSYQVDPKFLKKSLSALKIYFYANNLGIIWRANGRKIDPDFPYLQPPAKTYSFGIQAGF